MCSSGEPLKCSLCGKALAQGVGFHEEHRGQLWWEELGKLQSLHGVSIPQMRRLETQCTVKAHIRPCPETPRRTLFYCPSNISSCHNDCSPWIVPDSIQLSGGPTAIESPDSRREGLMLCIVSRPFCLVRAKTERSYFEDTSELNESPLEEIGWKIGFCISKKYYTQNQKALAF